MAKSKDNKLSLVLVTVILVVALLLTINWGQKGAKMEKEDKKEDKEISVTLFEQNQSGMKGEVEVEEKDGKVEVDLEVKGSPAGASHPAHVHLGSCTNLGEVKYPLNNVINGKSETKLNISFEEFNKTQPMAVNVHKSSAEAAVYVACGDLEL
jgi:hypothetical protein